MLSSDHDREIVMLHTLVSKEAAASKFLIAEKVPSNDASLKSDKQLLGKELEQAFHNKQNVKAIQELVAKGAPVNYRLDYGLEIKLESEFVAAFFLLLQGDKDKALLLENAKKIISDEASAKGLASYVETAREIFDILHSKECNDEKVSVSDEFVEFVKTNAVELRGNPEHKNSALIIASGLRDAKLINEIISIGKEQKLTSEENGAAVNFKGFFGDTAAVWSAILLDKISLAVLLENGAEIENLGITGSSLLHWVAVAARLDDSKERQKNAIEIAQLLLQKGANPHVKNKLGLSPVDYATGELKKLLGHQLGAGVHSQQFRLFSGKQETKEEGSLVLGKSAVSPSTGGYG